jgi:uncharacterized ion transporter superfamily protein YfcC
MEGGGFAHLEGAIKNPFLKGIVEWSVKIIQAVFIPIAKIAQVVTGMVAKELFKKFSEGVKLLGGPGVFGFAILSGLLAEGLELIVKEYTNPGPKLLAALFPPLLPIVAAADSLITTVKSALAFYTYATIFINIIPVLQLLEKGKTESYTPKGEFKMQNGNLVFIK